MKVALPRRRKALIFNLLDHFFNSLFELYSGEGHVSAATGADNAYIASRAGTAELFGTAWMGLFQLKNIVNFKLRYLCHRPFCLPYNNLIKYITNQSQSKEYYDIFHPLKPLFHSLDRKVKINCN